MDAEWLAQHAWKLFPHTLAAKLSKGAYQTPAHVQLMSREIALAVQTGGLMIIEAPPRHSKSETISRWLPVWYLARNPDKHVVLASYSGTLASSNGRDVRNRLNEHAARLGVSIASDSSAADRWHTSAGGSCTSVGVGGTLTGYGGHLIIIDDPIKDAEEAESEVMRSKVIEWFRSVAWTRREPGALVVVMSTRWHQEDLSGWILDHPDLGPMAKRIRLPAIAEDDDVLGRGIGEPLWPARADLDELARARAGLGERWWNAMFQQRPSSQEGAEIKRAWWRRYSELPVPHEAMDTRALSVDATFRDSDGSDYVVIQSWGIYGTRRYLLGQVRERMGFVETVRAILTMRETWRPNVILIEAKANGDAIIEQLHREGVAELVGINPKASKTARARAASPQIEAGNVWLPMSRDADMLIEEAASFPLGKNDDMVDACSQLLNYLGDMRSEPKSDLEPGDNRWMSPDVARERISNDGWRSVFDRVRRSI